MSSDATMRAALARLLLRHRAGLLGYLFACLRNHDEAQQVLQELARTIAEGKGRLPAEHEFLSWARDNARAQILARGRFGQNQRPLDPVLVQRLSEAAVRIEAMRPAADYQAELLSCLEKVSVRGRLLLAMRHDPSVRDLAELARRLGRSIQETYALLKDVKTQLRNCVERRSAAKFDHGITRS